MPLIKQIAVCVQLASVECKTVLSNCLVALVDIVDDDALLKPINMGVLMHTRSDDTRLRIFALECSEKLWKAHGGKLLGTTFFTHHGTLANKWTCARIRCRNSWVHDGVRRGRERYGGTAGSQTENGGGKRGGQRAWTVNYYDTGMNVRGMLQA